MLKHAVFNIPEQLHGRKRKSALRLKVEAWSPYKNTAYTVAWAKNLASVFAWDSDQLSDVITKKGYDPSICDIVPESFITEPHTTGVRMVECADGFEAQVWRDGFLENTRWWAAPPPHHEWSLFCRAAGASGITKPPSIQNPDWLSFPWTNEKINSNTLALALRNKHFVVAGFAFLLAPCVFFTAEWVSYSLMSAQSAKTIATIEDETRSVRMDRMKALTALDAAEVLISLDPYPSQINIISRAHSLLSSHPITVSNWDYDEGILEFGILSDTDMDARVFISAFENDPMFSDVSAGTAGQRLVMRMKVGQQIGLER